MAARCSTDRPVAHFFTSVDALRSTRRERQRTLQRTAAFGVATLNRRKLLGARALWTYELRSSRKAWLPPAAERQQVLPMSVVGGTIFLEPRSLVHCSCSPDTKARDQHGASNSGDDARQVFARRPLQLLEETLKVLEVVRLLVPAGRLSPLEEE